MNVVKSGTKDTLHEVVEMMTLRIEVNGEEIGCIHAHNLETEEFVKNNPDGQCRYRVYRLDVNNAPKTVLHRRSNGILELSRKILKATEKLV